MKKIVYSLLISSFAALFVACDDNNPNEDKFGANPSAGYVEFGLIDDNDTPNDPTDDITYNGRTFNANIGCGPVEDIRVPIRLVAPVNENGLDVNVSVTDLVGTSAGNVTIMAEIPAGETEGELVISYSEALANTLAFKVTLESTESDAVTIGNPGYPGERAIIVQINKEPRDQFQGVYSVQRGTAEPYISVISSGDAPNELIVSNLFDNDPASQTTIFLNEDGTVSYPEPIDNYLTNDPNVGDLYVQGISGTHGSSCEGELTLVFRLRFGANLASQTGQFTTVFTRQ